MQVMRNSLMPDIMYEILQWLILCFALTITSSVHGDISGKEYSRVVRQAAPGTTLHVSGPRASVVLNCPVDTQGLEVKETSWMHNNVEVNASKTIKLETNGSIHLEKVEYPGDLGTYICTVTLNNDNKLTGTVLLEGKPFSNSLPQSERILEGNDLEIVCKPDGLPPPTIEWLVEGKAPGSRVIVENGTLKIPEIEKDDKGVYTCKATNKHGSYEEDITIRVRDQYGYLWPLIGIGVELVLLIGGIIIYECTRPKKKDDNPANEKRNTNADGLKK